MYRSCDDVWTFVVKNPQFKMEGPTATTYVPISTITLSHLSLSVPIHLLDSHTESQSRTNALQGIYEGRS
jgi:hypothetical protein